MVEIKSVSDPAAIVLDTQDVIRTTLPALMARRGVLALVAEGNEGAALGHVIARQVADEAEVFTLCVAPSYRRQGLAKQLLAELSAKLRSKGVNRLFFDVRASNVPARMFYESLGARQVGVREGYYAASGHDEAEDAISYRLQLA